MHTRPDRMLIVLWIALTVGGIALGLAVVTLIASPPAHGSSICERHNMQKVYTRGGRSWRCKRVRFTDLRQKRTQPMGRSDELTSGELVRSTVSDPVPPGRALDAVRTVRIIPITNGLTVHQRIERAFDKLHLFPVEDEP
jgi:hypothetical protein